MALVGKSKWKKKTQNSKAWKYCLLSYNISKNDNIICQIWVEMNVNFFHFQNPECSLEPDHYPSPCNYSKGIHAS